MATKLFRAIFQKWTATLATALAEVMNLWFWTFDHVQRATDALGHDLYYSTRRGVTFSMANAISWLLAARQFLLDVRTLASFENVPDVAAVLTELVRVQAARVASF